MKDFENIIMLAGNGRNVGKTLLSGRIISHLTENGDVYGIKISSHFHELSKDVNYIVKTEDYEIIKEKAINNKDSSRMLQAGAKEVYYVQCKDEALFDMFHFLLPLIPPKKPIIIESGGLYNVVNPKMMFYIQGEDTGKRVSLREGPNRFNLTSDEALNLNIKSLTFNNGCFMDWIK
nr:hypothetical protein [uncultured Carboxylicivirga sp.]